ncbi:Hypothetical predicted protein [Pelobates cultripes]|uniref:Uncharacterized protein n=1 Tax=Pelobates cultripes TaxID=61616 RepID=A0AAD1TJQ0_PELCU|nr:Hypothetical predicted protein [Pelobates cultripes]
MAAVTLPDRATFTDGLYTQCLSGHLHQILARLEQRANGISGSLALPTQNARLDTYRYTAATHLGRRPVAAFTM